MQGYAGPMAGRRGGIVELLEKWRARGSYGMLDWGGVGPGPGEACYGYMAKFIDDDEGGVLKQQAICCA
jgi:hypothetical protein